MAGSVGTGAPRPAFFETPGYGERMGQEYHYSQAVRIGDRIDISGQGGWDDDSVLPEAIEDEVRGAFENVERTLNSAGASWKDVVSVVSYHVPIDESQPNIDGSVLGQMIDEFRVRMPDQKPIWTTVGCTKLGAPGVRIEIAVTAVAPESA
jgi:enamine deaminase RidA (YjgF/YER057c/UK114 family)